MRFVSVFGLGPTRNSFPSLVSVANHSFSQQHGRKGDVVCGNVCVASSAPCVNRGFAVRRRSLRFVAVFGTNGAFFARVRSFVRSFAPIPWTKKSPTGRVPRNPRAPAGNLLNFGAHQRCLVRDIERERGCCIYGAHQRLESRTTKRTNERSNESIHPSSTKRRCSGTMAENETREERRGTECNNGMACSRVRLGRVSNALRHRTVVALPRWPPFRPRSAFEHGHSYQQFLHVVRYGTVQVHYEYARTLELVAICRASAQKRVPCE